MYKKVKYWSSMCCARLVYQPDNVCWSMSLKTSRTTHVGLCMIATRLCVYIHMRTWLRAMLVTTVSMCIYMCIMVSHSYSSVCASASTVGIPTLSCSYICVAMLRGWLLRSPIHRWEGVSTDEKMPRRSGAKKYPAEAGRKNTPPERGMGRVDQEACFALCTVIGMKSFSCAASARVAVIPW